MFKNKIIQFGSRSILLIYGLVMVFYGLTIFKFQLLNEYIGSLIGIIIVVQSINITLLLLFITIGFTIFLAQIHWWQAHRKKPISELLLIIFIEFVFCAFIFLVLAFIYLLVYSINNIPISTGLVVVLQFICFFLGIHILFSQARVLEGFARTLLHHPRRFRDFYRHDE